MKRLFLAAAVLAMTLAVAAPARACPNCSDSLPSAAQAEDGAEPTGSLAEGFYWSILLMMGAPFVVVGGLGGMLYVTIKRSGQAAQPLQT